MDHSNSYANRTRNSTSFVKVNVLLAISKMKVCRPFFFMERTITGRTYLDMLENWLML